MCLQCSIPLNHVIIRAVLLGLYTPAIGLTLDQQIAISALIVGVIAAIAAIIAAVYAVRADRSARDSARVADKRWEHQIHPRVAVMVPNPLTTPTLAEDLPPEYQLHIANPGSATIDGYALFHIGRGFYETARLAISGNAHALSSKVLKVGTASTNSETARALLVIGCDIEGRWWDMLLDERINTDAPPRPTGSDAFLEWV